MQDQSLVSSLVCEDSLDSSGGGSDVSLLILLGDSPFSVA